MQRACLGILCPLHWSFTCSARQLLEHETAMPSCTNHRSLCVDDKNVCSPIYTSTGVQAGRARGGGRDGGAGGRAGLGAHERRAAAALRAPVVCSPLFSSRKGEYVKCFGTVQSVCRASLPLNSRCMICFVGASSSQTLPHLVASGCCDCSWSKHLQGLGPLHPMPCATTHACAHRQVCVAARRAGGAQERARERLGADAARDALPGAGAGPAAWARVLRARVPRQAPRAPRRGQGGGPAGCTHTFWFASGSGRRSRTQTLPQLCWALRGGLWALPGSSRGRSLQAHTVSVVGARLGEFLELAPACS